MKLQTPLLIGVILLSGLMGSNRNGQPDGAQDEQSRSETQSENALAAAATLNVTTASSPIAAIPGQFFRDCPDCPEMVVIPAGSFEMGSNDGDSEEKPVHRVTISRNFALGKTEVTQGQWRAIMGNNPSYFKSCGDDCPVESVSWGDAQDFIRRLNQKTGKQYRLPTEAEWEYACRSGGRQECCGSDNLDSVGWYVGNSGATTHPIGRMQANVLGLYDMSGNVWEWVEDNNHDSYAGAPTDGSAWQGDGASRMLRGGSWYSRPQGGRAAFRSWGEPARRDDDIGFRLARMLP